MKIGVWRILTKNEMKISCNMRKNEMKNSLHNSHMVKHNEKSIYTWAANLKMSHPRAFYHKNTMSLII